MIDSKHNIGKSFKVDNKYIELVYSGDDYFSRLHKIISEATKTLHIQTYIFDEDNTGKEVLNTLLTAANRGIEIYILLDAYGSFSLSNKTISNLISYGIHIRFFSPFKSSNNFYIGRRLHHKIVVADGNVALVGGINIANKYRGSSGIAPWLDYAVQINNTELSKKLQTICSTIYLKRNRGVKLLQTKTSIESTVIGILRNDWLKRKNEIARAYLNQIKNAQSEIILIASYFLPGRKFLSELKKASARGVKVKLILSGISDVPLANNASKYLYHFLLKNSIEVFEWNKSVLHAKVAMIDNVWVTIGSYNLNHLSSYGSIELNIEINSSKFATEVGNHINEVIKQCDVITSQTQLIRNTLWARFVNWLSYRITRIGLITATYLPRKRFKKIY